MKVIIAGSRCINDYEVLLEAIKNSEFYITEVISGGAIGVDALGERWARSNRKNLHIYKANWKEQGNSAGRIRNVKMAENADALIAIWDGVSPGTKHMIETATLFKLKVYVEHWPF